MRIFKNFIEAHREIERELRHSGVIYQSESYQDKSVKDKDEFLTKELIGYSFLVRDPQVDGYINELGLDRQWIDNEFLERISGLKLNPGDAYKLRNVWDEFVHDGKFAYTYSERIGNQIIDIIKLLTENKSSRHAMIFIYQPEIDNPRRGGKIRIPCSIYYNFFIRKEGDTDKLSMIYNIRSNDFGTHFPYDIVLARMLQQNIALILEIPAGDLIYQSGSLHVFKKDYEEVF